MNYIAILADIKQAFLNIEISSEHKRLFKINGKFLKSFIEDLYADDVTSGTESVMKGKEFYEKSKKQFCLKMGST